MAEITSPLVVRPPTPDNDFFVGTAVSEFVMLLAGDDYAAMAGGNDLAEGDPGNDTLSGGAGDDVLRGEAGLDWLFGDDDDDEIDSGTESDTIVGGPGVDSLTGGMGNDDFTIEPGDLTGSTIATPEVITDFMGAGVLGGDEIIWKTGGVQLGVVGPFATAPGEPLNVFVFFDPANPAEQLVLQLPGVTGFTGTGTPMAGQLSQLTGDILFVRPAPAGRRRTEGRTGRRVRRRPLVRSAPAGDALAAPPPPGSAGAGPLRAKARAARPGDWIAHGEEGLLCGSRRWAGRGRRRPQDRNRAAPAEEPARGAAGGRPARRQRDRPRAALGQRKGVVLAKRP